MSDHIQIGDVTPRVQYVADGAMTDYTYPFPIFQTADLEVYVDGVMQSSGFTVVDAGNSAGGSVSFAVAPASGAVLVFRRFMSIQRTTDFQEGGTFLAKTINDELDRQTAFSQQLETELSRALVQEPADSGGTLTLPVKTNRASKVLAFDADGNPVQSNLTLTEIEGGATGPIGPIGPQGPAGNDGADGADGLFAGTEASVSAVEGDLIALKDASDSNAPKFATVQSILDLGGVDQVARDNTILNALELARIDGLSSFAMVNTVVDTFTDVTGIDAAASTNESHDNTNKLFEVTTGSDTTYSSAGSGTYNVPAGVSGVLVKLWGGGGGTLGPTGGYFGEGGGGGGFTMAGLAVTPGGTVAYTVGAGGGNVSGNPPWTGMQGGAGGDSTFGSLTAGGGQGGANTSVFAGVGGIGATENGETGLGVHASGTTNKRGGNAGGQAYGGGQGGGSTGGNPCSGYPGTAPGGGGGGGSSGLNGGVGAEGRIIVTPINDITLVSNAITAASDPGELRVLIDHEEVSTVTMNTDCLIDVTRDGGTTWTAGVLSTVRDAGSGRKALACNVDVSAQPSGTSVKMRWRSANGKQQKLHSWAVQADVALSL